MPSPQPSGPAVVIAGAGPVGLFLSCELRLAGASVLVLERASNPFSALKALPFGLRGLSAPTLAAFDRRGLLDDVQAAQQARDAGKVTMSSAHWMQQRRQAAGHFAGIPFFHENVDPARWPYRLPSPAGATLAVDLQSLETVLAARATAMGADIRRGVGVDGFAQTGDGVTVSAGDETV